MGWAVDANVTCGSTRIANFFVFKGTLYLNAHATYLHRYVGPGVWNPVTIGGFQARNGIVWNDMIWATVTNTIYRSWDGVTWTADIDTFATWSTYPRGYGGWNNYMYLAHLDEAYPFPDAWMLFARRDKFGNWVNNVCTPQYVWQGSPSATSQIMDYDDGDYIFWTSCYNILGDQIWHNGAWSAGPLGVATTRYIRYGGSLFACGAEAFSDPSKEGVFRWTGTHWIEEAAFSMSRFGYLSVGDDNDLYFGCDLLGARLYERNNKAWTLIGINPGGAGASTAVRFGDDLFYTDIDGLWPAGLDIYRYVPDFNVSVSGLYPQAMDVDGDADSLYIGLIDNATTFPVLVKVPLPLIPSAAGVEVYTGTAGTAINVECPNVGQRAVIAGNFGMNEQVEVSEDGGLSWVDIDRDAWGAETAQPVLVDPDTVDEVMVALQTAQAITETDDGGATAWTVNNPAVGYGPAAMARLSADSDELVIGDADAARKIEYSPNRGTVLTDITGGFVGDCVALEVA